MTRDEAAITSEEAVRLLVEAMREDLVECGYPVGWLHRPVERRRGWWEGVRRFFRRG